MTQAITKFSGEFDFLSNFYPSPILVGGDLYPTVEHAFQALKTLDKEERKEIRLASTPGRAKRLGRKCTLRSDWETHKVSIMDRLIFRKFASSSELEEKL